MATPTTDVLLGPLTTAFSAPPDCTSITVSPTEATYAPFVYPRLFSSIASSCFPSSFPLGNTAFTTTFGIYDYQDQHVYYSPGLCPSGWGSTSVGSTGNETTAICCGPGFSTGNAPAVQGGGTSTYCASSVDETTVTTIAYTGDGETYGSSSAFTFSGNVIPAPGIWIRYKPDDFITTTSSSSSSSSKPSSSSLPSSSSPSIVSPTTTTSPGSHTPKSLPSSTSSSSGSSSSSAAAAPTSGPAPTSGLSTGAKAGIGIGASFAGLFALLLLAFLFMRRRTHGSVAEMGGNEEAPAALSGGPVSPAAYEFKNVNQRGGGIEDGSLSPASARPQSELPAGDVNWRQDMVAAGAAGGGARIVPVSELDGEMPRPYTWRGDRY